MTSARGLSLRLPTWLVSLPLALGHSPPSDDSKDNEAPVNGAAFFAIQSFVVPYDTVSAGGGSIRKSRRVFIIDDGKWWPTLSKTLVLR